MRFQGPDFPAFDDDRDFLDDNRPSAATQKEPFVKPPEGAPEVAPWSVWAMTELARTSEEAHFPARSLNSVEPEIDK